MNQILSNIAQAKSNPHVFWPVVIAAAVKVLTQIVFEAIDIYAPGLKGQNAAMQDMLSPYLNDLYQFATGYAALAASTSGPVPPPSQPQPVAVSTADTKP